MLFIFQGTSLATGLSNTPLNNTTLEVNFATSSDPDLSIDNDFGNAIQSNEDFFIIITYANYGDFDGATFDNAGTPIPNDVIIEFDIHFPEKNGVTKIRIDLEMELPSGFTWEATFKFKSKSGTATQSLVLYAYNSAIEPGWYTAWLTGYLYGNSGTPISCSSSIYFDPPAMGTGAQH